MLARITREHNNCVGGAQIKKGSFAEPFLIFGNGLFDGEGRQ